MPPRGYPPFLGNNMSRSPMQIGGMTRSPLNMGGGMGRSPLNMLGGMNQNPMQMMGRMSGAGSRMPMGAGGMTTKSGGLISRLFQRAGIGAGGGAGNVANAANAATGFQRAAGGGGLLKGLTNPGAIGSFLNNTQNVLRSAQQIGPMVQQYGPLLRNLPAMWKMYRGLKSTDSDDNSKENNDKTTSTEDDKSTSGSNKRITTRKEKNKNTAKTTKKKVEFSEDDNETGTPSLTNTKGTSVPKLYI
jgi:hypothetical protein